MHQCLHALKKAAYFTGYMLYDNDLPRYLPHVKHPEVLLMGLSPLRGGFWIETDNHLGRYQRHKLLYREQYGERAYRCSASSMGAQQELKKRLQHHLTTGQSNLYQLKGQCMQCPTDELPLVENSDEPLWDCSLWVADDLVLMEEIDGEYCLTAASLCSPSHWKLEEKFGHALREIHDPIPGFHAALTPRIDRFFKHLRAEHPVVRFNWSIQGHGSLSQRPEQEVPIGEDSLLYYRSERQSLVRLPETGAIAFTIRVYLHQLETLAGFPGALEALFAAIEAAPPELSEYKGFPDLSPALARYAEFTAGL